MENLRSEEVTRICNQRPNEADANYSLRQEKDLGIVEGMGKPFAMLHNTIDELQRAVREQSGVSDEGQL